MQSARRVMIVRIVLWFLPLSVGDYQGDSIFKRQLRETHGAQRETAIVRAIDRLLEESYAERTNKVDILLYHSDELQKQRQLRYLQAVLKGLSTLTVRLDLTLSLQLDEPRNFLLIVVDRPSSLRTVLTALNRSPFNFAGFMILYFTEFPHLPLEAQKLEGVFRECLQFNVIHVILLQPSYEDYVSLYTFYPFTEGRCYNSIPVEFCRLQRDRFLPVGQSDKRRCELFPIKLRDFHGCPVFVNIREIPPEIIFTRSIFGGHLEGFEGALLDVFAKKLNLRLNVTYLRSQDVDAMTSLGSANFSVGRNYVTAVQDNVSSSVSYYSSRLVLVARAGERLTSLQQVRLILDNGLWTLLCLLIGVPYGVLLLFHVWRRRSLRDLVLGTGRSRPFYGVCVSTVGANVVPEPRGTLARVMFVGWLWLTLVLRQSFQSTLYAYIHMAQRSDGPQTLDAVLSRGARIGISPSLLSTVERVPQFKGCNLVAIRISELEAMQWLEKRRHGQEALITPLESFRFFQQTHGSTSVLYAIDEVIFDLKICIHYRKRSLLVPVMDDMILRLLNSGLISYWESVYTSRLVRSWNASDEWVAMPTKASSHTAFITAAEFKGLLSLYMLALGACSLVLLVEFVGYFVERGGSRSRPPWRFWVRGTRLRRRRRKQVVNESSMG